MLCEIVKHEVKMSSTSTVNAEVCFRCKFFSGGFVKSSRKNISEVMFYEIMSSGGAAISLPASVPL